MTPRVRLTAGPLVAWTCVLLVLALPMTPSVRAGTLPMPAGASGESAVGGAGTSGVPTSAEAQPVTTVHLRADTSERRSVGSVVTILISGFLAVAFALVVATWWYVRATRPRRSDHRV